jgi:two-component system, OmpR family, phosphate regulon sensor histidine kinase PhoR
MTGRILLKILVAIAALLAVALYATEYLVSRVAASGYSENLRRDLEDKAKLLVSAESLSGNVTDVKSLAAIGHARITIVDRSGKVVADSSSDPKLMENHRNRPEIAAALRGQSSSTTRMSQTRKERYLYLAVPIQSGALRLAVPVSQIESEVSEIRWKMLQSTAAMFVVAMVVAAFFARRLSQNFNMILDHAAELANGNFQARSKVTGRGEFALLSGKLNETSAKLERTVQQMQSEHTELEKLERVRKDFVINVSHELRTPLASIQGYTETLMDGAIEDRQNNMRFLSIIRHNAERLTTLTADLLTLSRIELKTQQFHFAAYDVNGLLGDILDSMRPIAGRKEISLDLDPAPAGAEVFCDSQAMYQILSNLLDNAVKYTPEGGVITVGGRPFTDREGIRRVEVFVRDTGAGIPPEDLPRLFERFYRVDKARSRELGGTGLGLAIVKHLVRAQGGEVRVESQLGHGSTFLFTLPVDDSPEHQTRELHGEFTAS